MDTELLKTLRIIKNGIDAGLLNLEHAKELMSLGLIKATIVEDQDEPRYYLLTDSGEDLITKLKA